MSSGSPRDLHSFPTRRSSDLASAAGRGEGEVDEVVTHLRGLQEGGEDDEQDDVGRGDRGGRAEDAGVDRKSTRLNSSHVRISYAVFCLKKKNIRDEAEAIAES